MNTGDRARQESDAALIYKRSGIGTRVGFGSRPALLVVDFQNGFTNPHSKVGGDLTAPIALEQVFDELRAIR